jgi:hypothetical protein
MKDYSRQRTLFDANIAMLTASRDSGLIDLERAGSWRSSMVVVTENAVGKLRQMQREAPSKGAFRVIFKGFG